MKQLVTSISVRILFVLMTIALSVPVYGQDRYFTQFYANQVDLNPALSGAIDGTYRFTGTYRDQWRGLVESPYVTFGVYGDLKFSIGNSRTSEDFAGVGVSFVADKMAVLDLNWNEIRISGAYHKTLDKQTRQYLSGGFYFGLIQQSVNYERLTFDDQFNGLDGYTFGTNETLPENNFAFGDLGLGLHYSVSPSRRNRVFAGLALAHLTTPSLSYFRRTESIEDEEFPDIQLETKFVAHVGAQVELQEQVYLLPRFLYQSQGEHLLMNAGANVKFGISKYNTNALHLGAGLRLANDLGSIAPTALVLLGAMEMNSVVIGMSYDLNLDDLTMDREGQGVFELTITYIGNYENESALCPSF